MTNNIFKAKVESAEYRKNSTTAMMMLIVIIVVHFGNSVQKICDTMNIENENLLAEKISKARAKELALACGFEKRPTEDKVSELVGHEILVRLKVDDDGDFKVLKYLPVADNNISKSIDGGVLTF